MLQHIFSLKMKKVSNTKWYWNLMTWIFITHVFHWSLTRMILRAVWIFSTSACITLSTKQPFCFSFKYIPRKCLYLFLFWHLHKTWENIILYTSPNMHVDINIKFDCWIKWLQLICLSVAELSNEVASG